MARVRPVRKRVAATIAGEPAPVFYDCEASCGGALPGASTAPRQMLATRAVLWLMIWGGPHGRG